MSSRIDLLAGIPLFAAFGEQELAALDDLLVERRFRRGQAVCREGEAGESFYVVLSGELEVSLGDPPRVINRLGAGDCFGELSLLLGGPRTATVTAARGATLLELHKDEFDRSFLDNAKVLEYLARLVSRRLADARRARLPARRSTAVAVTAQPGARRSGLVAASLAVALADILRCEVLLVRAGGGSPAPQARGLEKLASESPEQVLRELRPAGEGMRVLDLAAPEHDDEARLADAFGALFERLHGFRWVVLDLGHAPAALQRATHQFAHRVIDVSRSASAPAAVEGEAPVLRVVERHDARSMPIPIAHCEPFVLTDESALDGADVLATARRLVGDPRAPAGIPLRRLARRLLGSTVGIALGGGAAFGIAHVGVLQVFEEEGIPVDLVAGTSMGSIVALGCASGLSGAEMREIAARIGTLRTTLGALDFTLTRPGLLAGDRLISTFLPLMPVHDFSELVRPCRTVATDIESGECVPIQAGRLDMAFRASCSVPVIWSPVRYLGRVLVDGAMVNPVPVDVAREMGADVTIAINVVPSLKRGVDTALARAYRTLNRLNPLAYVGSRRGLPSLFDVTMNSIQQLQHELGAFKGISADVQITPDLTDFTWIEFYRPLELIERGAEAARRALPEVRRVLAERLEAA